MNSPRSAVLLLLFLSVCVCATGSPEPLCVISPTAMPHNWRPLHQFQSGLSAAPWSAVETNDAEYAVKRGLNELTDYFSSRPATVLSLGEDAVEPFLDASYSAANMPALQVAARDQGRRVLTPLLVPYVGRLNRRPVMNIRLW